MRGQRCPQIVLFNRTVNNDGLSIRTLGSSKVFELRVNGKKKPEKEIFSG